MAHLEPGALLRLIGAYGRLRARLREELSKPPLVLPNGQYFPDHFDGSAAATQRLVLRMQQHAGIADIPIRIVQGQVAEAAAKHCSSGGCGPSVSAPDQAEPRLMLDEQEGWLLRIEAAEAAHPVGLTTLVARSLGLVLLEETRLDGSPLPVPLDVHQELAGVMMGFGVLLLEGSHVYSKSCGGPQVARLTALSTSELAVVTALFTAEHNASLKPALRLVAPTQRAELEEANALLRGNPRLLDWTRAATELDADPTFTLAPPRRPLFGGLFERRRPETSSDLDDLELALQRGFSDVKRLPSAASGPKQAAVDDELKALVAEALRSEV